MKVLRAVSIRGTDLIIRAASHHCAEIDGVLVPQPEGDVAAYCTGHPIFEWVTVARERAEELGLRVRLEEEKRNPEPPISDSSAVLDLDSLSWNDLKEHAQDCGLTVGRKSRAALTAELLGLSRR